jgi:hypothetical protein
MDALAVLGKFPSGDQEKAHNAIASLAGYIGRDLRETALDIISVLTNNIRSAAQEFIDEVNRYPVYTIYEMLHPEVVEPRHIMAVGGPAQQLKPFLEEAFGMDCTVPVHAMVANALGAALARTTTQITVTADTQLGYLICPELGIKEPVNPSLTMEDLKKRGVSVMRSSIEKQGISDAVEISVLEEQSFNIVRGFSTAGKNFRLKLQTRPGILDEWRQPC